MIFHSYVSLPEGIGFRQICTEVGRLLSTLRPHGESPGESSLPCVSSRIGFPTIQCSQKEITCGVTYFLGPKHLFSYSWVPGFKSVMCQYVNVYYVSGSISATGRSENIMPLVYRIRCFEILTTSLRGAVAVTPVTPRAKLKFLRDEKPDHCWVCPLTKRNVAGLNVPPFFLTNNSLFWLCFLEILASHVYGFWMFLVMHHWEWTIFHGPLCDYMSFLL